MGAKGYEELVSDVINNGLCTGCGTCVAVCPVLCLGMKFSRLGHCIPRIQYNCKDCGLCYKICPGRSVMYNKLNRNLFQIHNNPRDDWSYCLQSKTTREMMGAVLEAYVGYSLNPRIRHKGSSGGIVSSLLISALENEMIDGAVVVGMNEERPWEPEVKIARSKKEILSAAQSKYTLVPVNAVLRKLLKMKGGFALVGLPCHVHGLRNLEYYRKNSLTKRIAFIVGLFCGYNLRTVATTFLLKKLGIVDYEKIETLEYRGHGYPGGFLVRLKDGKEFFIKKLDYDFLYYLFTPERCSLCIDFSNELADISVGDMLSEKSRIGLGTIITRTEKGRHILAKAIESGYLKTFPIPPMRILESNQPVIISKKIGGLTRIKGWQSRGYRMPFYETDLSGIEYRAKQFVYENFQNSLRGQILSTILKYAPLRVSSFTGRILLQFSFLLNRVAYRDYFI